MSYIKLLYLKACCGQKSKRVGPKINLIMSNNGVLLLQGALEMRNKTVADRYTPLENVFMLDANCKLDHDTMTQVSAQEFEK